MEAILIGAVAQYLIPLLGVAITALVGYGISMLKKKTDSDIAKNALDQVDQIVGTVVGNLSQMVGKQMKAGAKDGHLSQVDKQRLKNQAHTEVTYLISDQLAKAAEVSVADLHNYIADKIEDWVPIKKASMQVMPQIQMPAMSRLKAKTLMSDRLLKVKKKK